ncbi:MAG TPA: sialidase family protein [Pirellulaceae bacterium]|nr:sialidase family protein [Pirellulaceae bacterium]
MHARVNRRSFVAATAAAGALWSLPRFAKAAAPAAEILETKIISQQPTLYHGWPTLARRKNGQLLLVCSGGREAHVCPFGRVELMTSDDGGNSWTYPRVLIDGPIDDRDAGVMETAKGTILVTTFTSLAYEPVLAKAEKDGNWESERLARWQAANNRLSAERRKEDLGVWMIRSTDDGVTWSQRYDCLVDSPHGPIQLADGRLLYAGKDLWRQGERVGFCESADDGQTWRWLSQIPVRDGDSHTEYHELHAVETEDGRIVCHVRNHNKANERETLQCESADGGKTWSKPKSIGVWGLPSHLLKLKDNRLLMTYGHRRKPLGNQARLSTDHGRTWSEPIELSGDGITGDLGYPSTVELDDGTLVTVWYEVMKDSPRAVLRQAKWKLPA